MSSAKTLVTDYLRTVWNEGNVEACDRFLAPSYVIHRDPGDPWDGQTLTLQAFKDRVRISRAPFPDQAFFTDTLLEEAGTVTVAWHWEGTFLADLPGFPATGKVVRTTGITIYHTSGARITGHHQVTDRLSVLQQLR
jgi:steroid delta-isomerase-like uncharacterized protein